MTETMMAAPDAAPQDHAEIVADAPVTDAYRRFLEAKIRMAEPLGFEVAEEDVNPALSPHARAIVPWACRGGRRAIFASFGLQKTSMQIEIGRQCLTRHGGHGLIVVPLGVRHEFFMEQAARHPRVRLKFVRRAEEMDAPELPGAETVTIHLTNYETVRDGKLDPALFTFASLDEAACLRGFGGTKTFREFMRLFDSVRFRFCATAVPDPNEYIELIAYAAFLGVMEVGEAKTRFFKRDSEKADRLTIHPHKEEEFWIWVASWALFIQRPSDLGFSDEGFELPPLDVRWHEVPSDHATAGAERDGQARMFRNAAFGVTDAAKEKRDSLDARVAKLLALRAEDPEAHRIIWHDLEREREAIEAACEGVTSVYGAMPLYERETRVIAFATGAARELATKPVLNGSGCNFQRHCAWSIYLGIGFKFHDFIQSVFRIQRFGQTRQCRIDLIYTEAEREIRRELEAKWARFDAQAETMAGIIRRYGLASQALADRLVRTIGVERQEVAGERWRMVNADCVDETRRMETDSVDLIVTSIPFATQYEYTPSYNDFGHTDDNPHFWEQMDFLVPELLRVLRPGRVAAIHVKDRIVPGGLTGLGFQTVQPFSDECVAHFRRHGFAFLARKTIVTDVVRENNQTYRLGWTEQCKDGSRMGCGMPEYVLLFRKPPSDASNGYADVPVVKVKPLALTTEGEEKPFDTRSNWKKPVPGTGYSRARWQFDAHGFARSSGDRLLSSDELRDLPHEAIYKLWRDRSTHRVYDFAGHVTVAEVMDFHERLPATFMLLPPHSWHPDVWTDVARMRTLNGLQAAHGRELHLCLARGSLILTRAGYKPIEEVGVGDEVLTHRGRWRRVLVARQTGVQPVVNLRAQGVAALTLTPDHRLWLRKSDWARSRDGAARTPPDWVRADQSVGGYVNLKLPPVEPCHLTDRECWLLGRWLADGHVGTRGEFVVSIGRDKLHRFEQMAGTAAGTRSEGTAVQIRLKGLSEALRSALAECGSGAGAKQVPVSILTAPEDKAGAFLDGYLSGDGHLVAGRGTWMATSVSRALLLGIAMIAQRVHGAVAVIRAGRRPGSTTIEGREVQTRQEWVMSFDMPGVRRKTPFVLDDGAWKKVRAAEAAGETETWCLRVEEDESFTAEGCIVKNCPLQFDIVDRLIEQFSMPGETVLDPFAGIGTVPYCAVKLGRGGRGVELNGGYFRDAVAYLRAAEAEMSVPSLFDLLEAGAAA